MKQVQNTYSDTVILGIAQMWAFSYYIIRWGIWAGAEVYFISVLLALHQAVFVSLNQIYIFNKSLELYASGIYF